MSESKAHDDLEEYHFEENEEHEAHAEAHEPIIERAHDEEGMGAKIIKLLKDYGLYVGVACLIIIPAILNLKDNIFGPSAPKPVQRQALTFTQTVPSPQTSATTTTTTTTTGNTGTIQRDKGGVANKDTAVNDLLPPAPTQTVQPAAKNVTVPPLETNTIASEPTDKLTLRLDALEKSVAATGEQIKALVNQEVVAVNDAQFKALNNRISSMGSAITELSRQLYNQQQVMVQIQQGLAARTVTTTSTVHKKAKPKQSEEMAVMAEDAGENSAAKSKLTLDAAIPGRAWLLGADGETSTVTEGDEIPGYGRVTKIDPAAGVVMTSSGRVIRAVDS